LIIESPLRQTSFQGQYSKNIGRGSPVRGKGRNFRRQRGQTSLKKTPQQVPEEIVLNIDFHEDFPPLPKSVKPDQSATLQKLAQASAITKESNQAVDSIPDLFEHIVASRPQSSGSFQESITPLYPNTIRIEGDHDIPSHRSSVQGTPAFPRAPPPSSAELSTAGNTAQSTPTVAYVRPRINPQSLHDRLVHANATLATLQEGRPFSMSRSFPTSPLLGPTLSLGELAQSLIVGDPEEISELMESLDTTARGIPVETVVRKEWVAGGSLIET
jgi:hypothetical protein